MAQAGIHAMVGMLARKFANKRRWLLFGAILGSFVPDMDNFGVAVATLAKTPTEGIHRTATHSIFFMMAVVAVFYVLGQVKRTRVGAISDLVWGWDYCFTACWILLCGSMVSRFFGRFQFGSISGQTQRRQPGL